MWADGKAQTGKQVSTRAILSMSPVAALPWTRPSEICAHLACSLQLLLKASQLPDGKVPSSHRGVSHSRMKTLQLLPFLGLALTLPQSCSNADYGVRQSRVESWSAV